MDGTSTREAIAFMLMGYFQPVARAELGNFLGTPKATSKICSKMRGRLHSTSPCSLTAHQRPRCWRRLCRLAAILRAAATRGCRRESGCSNYTPIGPIRVDVARPLDPRPGDYPVVFYVSIGQP